LQAYVPEYALFSYVDEIPGIIGKCLPFDPLNFQSKFKFHRTKPLFISNIELDTGYWNHKPFLNKLMPLALRKTDAIT